MCSRHDDVYSGLVKKNNLFAYWSMYDKHADPDM